MFKLSPKVVVAVSSIPGILKLSPEWDDQVLKEREEGEEKEVSNYPHHYFSTPHFVVRVDYYDSSKSA